MRCFQIGDRVRVNYWVDRRESGWRCGVVIGIQVDCYGIVAQSVRWDAGYESLIAVTLLEPEPQKETVA